MSFPERLGLGQMIPVFATRNLLRVLKKSEGEEEHNLRLHLFFAHVFLIGRQFSVDERKKLIEAAVPNFAFAKEAETGPYERLSEMFDEVYLKFLSFIRQKIAFHGNRFIEISPVAKDWIAARLQAEYQKA